ncbi:HprK-related kinase A [Aestuariibacter halophilus]|uniref:HprK-related kinase A n=1 Tax=Fluctibacter halophilus TaxID=226011 RepID=A0ABS8G2Z5_9ALTE|nr:HprK-related kinase A [Aestuariibacter halophilus]MCC2614908.1 HprK-related kinase A [Aestuariibacter halophilus]
MSVTLSRLSPSALSQLLCEQGAVIQTGRYVARIRSQVPHLAKDLLTLYGHTPLRQDDAHDFLIDLTPGKGLRRWVHPYVNFALYGNQPFTPLPIAQSTPLLEWGMNWCVSNQDHRALIIHAAVVERNGRAIIMPGQPGAGKSTLCAALVASGVCRLLSDELTLMCHKTAEVLPNPRPISLKNRAIDIIAERFPDIPRTATVQDTLKGAVSLFRAPQSAIEGTFISAKPGIVVFPRYRAGLAQPLVERVGRGRTFVELANQSFNYPVLGEQGFATLQQHVSQCRAYRLEYAGDLDQAIDIMDELLHDE